MGGRERCCSEDEKAWENSEIEQREPKSRRFVPAEGQRRAGPGLNREGGESVLMQGFRLSSQSREGAMVSASTPHPTPPPPASTERAQLPSRGEQGCLRQNILCPCFLCSRVRERAPRVPLVPGRSWENVNASHGAPGLDGKVAGASHPTFPLGASKRTSDLRNTSLMQVSPYCHWLGAVTGTHACDRCLLAKMAGWSSPGKLSSPQHKGDA